MNPRSLAALLVLVAAAACRAGQGNGRVEGEMAILDCFEERDPSRDPRLLGAAKPYNMNPQFFAGEPIGDIRAGVKANRLLIRIQTTGRRRESVDGLLFDVPDSLAAARCVRGRTKIEGGVAVPDYDEQDCFQGPNGPRLRVAPDALIRAHFIPNETCNIQESWMSQSKVVVATAVAPVRMVNDGNWESWIELTDFGSAAQRHLPPEQRAPCCGPDARNFKVEYDELIRAPAFQLNLVDDRLVKAEMYMLEIPTPRIGGKLAGQFDFDLARGQGAQTFP